MPPFQITTRHVEALEVLLGWRGNKKRAALTAENYSGNTTVKAGQSFETVARNLNASDGTITYNLDGSVSDITYANGIVKSFTYSLGILQSITLSGSVPTGFNLTKTFHYVGGDLVSWDYS